MDLAIKICLYLIVGFVFGLTVSLWHTHRARTHTYSMLNEQQAKVAGVITLMAWPFVIPYVIVLVALFVVMKLYGKINDGYGKINDGILDFLNKG